MLGNDLFKLESNVDLSNDRFKSLILFYTPLIGNDALSLYEFFLSKSNIYTFEELSKLLNSLLISIDNLEASLKKLNEYKLLKTLKHDKEDKYIFVLENPLTLEEFVNNDIFVRNFILKTSGEYYQSLLSNFRQANKHRDFSDVSYKLDLNILNDWSKEDESFLKTKTKSSSNYDFGTYFDPNKFLADVSLNLLPMKFRTEDNIKELATLADLYNVSYDKMRTFLPKVARSNSDNFDLEQLKYLCVASISEFKKIADNEYEVPCELFLMNKQNGKELTKFDKKIIYNLSHEYKLKPSVINVVLEHGLNNCNNSLIEKYLYSLASDLYRNDINDYKLAKERINNNNVKKARVKETIVPTYNHEGNVKVNKEELRRKQSELFK